MILMGSRTQKRLAALLMQLIENENKIEQCRLSLFKFPNIDLFKVFQQIDIPRRGFFKNDEMLEFLCKNNIYATTREIKYLVDQLDTDTDSIITYDNFLHFLAPQQDEAFRKEILVRERIQATSNQEDKYFSINDAPTPQKMKQSNVGASAFMSTAKSKNIFSSGQQQQQNQSFHKQSDVLGLDPEIEFLLSKLFYQMIQNFKAVEAKKEILHGSNDFQLEIAFKTIDTSNIDKLDYESLEEFLKKHNYQVQEKDLLVLLRTYGSLTDGFINEAQFMDMILPTEFNIKKNAVKQSFAKQTKINQTIQQTVQKPDPLVDPKKTVIFGQGVEDQNQSNQNLLTIPIGGKTINKIGTTANIKQDGKSVVMTQTKLTNDVYLNQSQPDSNQITIKKPLCRGTIKTPKSKRFLSTVQVRPGASTLMNINIEADAEEYDEVARGRYRGSSMKGDEEEYFVQKMYELVQTDLKLEEYKQELSSQRDFNLLDSFYFIDLQGKGYISQQDLYLNLRQLGLYPTKDQIYLFFKQYDLDFSNRLEFSEFVKTFIPIEQQYRNALNNRTATGNGFSSQTKHLLHEAFSFILQNAYDVEYIRQQLNRRKLFNTYDAFCAIDQDNNGFVTLEDFRTLFLDYDIHFSPKEIYYFFRRFDKGLDGQVCYGEFFSELTPKSPYSLSEERYTQVRKSMISLTNIVV